MRVNVEILSFFDLIITISIMQSADETASVNRNGHRERAT